MQKNNLGIVLLSISMFACTQVHGMYTTVTWLLGGQSDPKSAEYRALAHQDCAGAEVCQDLTESGEDSEEGIVGWLQVGNEVNAQGFESLGENTCDKSSVAKGLSPVSCEELVMRVTQLVKSAHETTQEAQKLFEEQKNAKAVLMRRTSPTFCLEVVQSLENNFAGTGIDPDSVYEFIKLSRQEGKKMTVLEVRVHIKNLLETKRIAQKKYRQLLYVFMNAESKEEYDAYLDGTLEQLRCVDEKRKSAMLADFEQFIKCGVQLADFHHILKQTVEE